MPATEEDLQTTWGRRSPGATLVKMDTQEEVNKEEANYAEEEAAVEEQGQRKNQKIRAVCGGVCLLSKPATQQDVKIVVRVARLQNEIALKSSYFLESQRKDRKKTPKNVTKCPQTFIFCLVQPFITSDFKQNKVLCHNENL